MPEEEILDPALPELINDHFTPAESYATAGLKLTTVAVHLLLEKHAPGRFHSMLVQPALKQLGFRTQLVGDELVWLLNARV